ncbi:REST corepressor 3-like [Babylonia areolata]|uniref:REST corepressor 3-like n=1 Tax=Babylonia areolata TaxID=304850 RepID=UPI003FD27B38
MVMADKNADDFRNGRRSRGASPRSEENSDESDSDQDNGMRIGEEFQAEIPNFNPDQKFDSGANAMLVWAPNADLPDAKVDEYISIAKEKHGYNTEQALGMLFWHKHNVERALTDLANFTPFPDEWTAEDKVLFEQAFSFHGKSFHRIRQMLPDKSIASLVKYFYSWKKTRSRTSLMDRHAKKRACLQDGEVEGGSDAASSNSDEDIATKEDEEKNTCYNCGLHTTQLHVTSLGSQCSSCYQYWRRTGVMRSTGPKRHESMQGRHNPIKHKRKPPKGMYLDSTDLLAMVTGQPAQPEAILKSLDNDIINYKRQVQNNKQLLSLQKHKMSNGVDDFKPAEPPNKINSRWTNEELLLAVQGVRKYGKNFQAIAEVIGNKLEAHVRSFFINFRRRYNLDEVLAEFEAEHGTQIIPEDKSEVSSGSGEPAASLDSTAKTKDKENKMEVDQTDSSQATATAAPAKPAQTNGSSGATTTNTTVTTTVTTTTPHAPPPLLKQTVPPTTTSPASTTPTSTTPKLVPAQKTILQQPPPLLRPANSTAQNAKTVIPAGAKDGKD